MFFLSINYHPKSRLAPKNVYRTNKPYYWKEREKKTRRKKAKGKPLNKQWWIWNLSMPCGWCLWKRNLMREQQKNQEQFNSQMWNERWNATDTWDLFTLNGMICNGLITCLYFGLILWPRHTHSHSMRK